MGVVSMRMIGAAVVALVLAAGAYAVPATAAPGDDGARAADVAGSAIALNLTSAEAATRADVQELAEQSGEVLSGNPEVAAFWLEDPPSTALVVATRLGSKLRITDLGLPPGLAKNARLVAVKHSEADLAATATAVGRAAQGRGRPVTVHVDVRSQVVEVTAADAASAAEVAADVQANPVPAADAVTVTVDDLAHPAAATIYAGMAGSGCTTGFTVVRTSDSKRGISTAAHCSNGQNIAGVSIPFVAEWWQYSSDIQWNSAGSGRRVPQPCPRRRVRRDPLLPQHHRHPVPHVAGHRWDLLQVRQRDLIRLRDAEVANRVRIVGDELHGDLPGDRPRVHLLRWRQRRAGLHQQQRNRPDQRLHQ